MQEKKVWNNVLSINCIILHKYLTCIIGIEVPTLQGCLEIKLVNIKTLSTETGTLEKSFSVFFFFKILFFSFFSPKPPGT